MTYRLQPPTPSWAVESLRTFGPNPQGLRSSKDIANRLSGANIDEYLRTLYHSLRLASQRSKLLSVLSRWLELRPPAYLGPDPSNTHCFIRLLHLQHSHRHLIVTPRRFPQSFSKESVAFVPSPGFDAPFRPSIRSSAFFVFCLASLAVPSKLTLPHHPSFFLF